MNCLGIDIGGTKMYMHMELNDGNIIYETIPTGKDCSAAYIKENIFKFIQNLEVKPDAIGVAIPGLVNDKKVILSDVLPNLSGVNAKELVGEYEVKLVNDVRAATIYEASKLNVTDTAIVIMVGTGIACGIYTEGKIIQGYNGYAGELGSISILVNDEVKRLDEISGGAAILANSNMRIEDLLEKLEQNDEKMSEIIKGASYYLGIAISDLIHIVNPNHIILGGSTVTFKGYFDNMLKTIEENTLEEMYKNCNIKITDSLKSIVAIRSYKECILTKLGANSR